MTLSRRDFVKGAAGVALAPLLAKVPAATATTVTKALPPPSYRYRDVVGWSYIASPQNPGPCLVTLWAGKTIYEQVTVMPGTTCEVMRISPCRITHVSANGHGTFTAWYCE